MGFGVTSGNGVTSGVRAQLGEHAGPAGSPRAAPAARPRPAALLPYIGTLEPQFAACAPASVPMCAGQGLGGREKRPAAARPPRAMRRARKVLNNLLEWPARPGAQVLYNLFEWPTRPGAALAVLGIANTLDLPERLLPRIACAPAAAARPAPVPIKRASEVDAAPQKTAGACAAATSLPVMPE